MISKIRQFMQGRYGSDQLNKALIIAALAISLVNMFVRSYIVTAVELLFVAFALYRMLSRKIQTRLRENRAFLNASGKIKRFFSRIRTRFKERKTHVYFKCPSCKAQLRLRRISGEHGVKCPRCGGEFRVKIK